jgi:hypothetical protein
LRGVTILLLFDNLVVGEITEAFEHQGTQFGNFQSTLPADGETPKRLRAFIEFSKNWFVRSGSEAGADAVEFDQYRDVVSSGKWSIQKPGRGLRKIQDAPMFQDGLNGEISWLEEIRSNDA